MRHQGASSIDLYREHLLNQLGRSGQWQASLQLREEVAPLSFEVEGETSFGIKNRISNSRPALVCPPGPLCTQPMWSHLSAGWRSRECFPPVSLLCYWARQACQKSLLWSVERPLSDNLAWPNCHSQVSQTPTVRERDYGDTDCHLSVCCLSAWPSVSHDETAIPLSNVLMCS